MNLSLVQSSHTEYRGLCSSIPDTWQTMFSLEQVSICIIGQLPDFIGENWQQLRSLHIAGGSFAGNIPPSLCKLSQLQHLDLSHNQFTGIIPECVFSMSSLIYLNLANNELSGPIPEAIGTMKNIDKIILSYNHLNGTLPRSIGKLNISKLALDNNLFIGAIPTEFDELTNSWFYNFNLTCCQQLKMDYNISVKMLRALIIRTHLNVPSHHTSMKQLVHTAIMQLIITIVKNVLVLVVGGVLMVLIVWEVHIKVHYLSTAVLMNTGALKHVDKSRIFYCS